MSKNEQDGSLPSYEDAVDPFRTQTPRQLDLGRVSSSSRGQQILDQLTLVRAQHIRSIIDENIIPIVEQQALYGIAQTTIAMIPSDISLPIDESEKSEFAFDTGDVKKVEAIGFSSSEEPQIVRLEGQMNRTEFWRPRKIVEELERGLKETLNSSQRLRDPSPPRAVEATKYTKRSLFGRLITSMNQERQSSSGNLDVDVRPAKMVGQVLVKARMEAVSLRTVNEFGLYDTISRQCVIVQVDARC